MKCAPMSAAWALMPREGSRSLTARRSGALCCACHVPASVHHARARRVDTPSRLAYCSTDLSFRACCGRNSAVECQLPKLDVAGSTPVARSEKPRNLTRLRGFFFYGYGIVRRGCGWVAGSSSTFTSPRRSRRNRCSYTARGNCGLWWPSCSETYSSSRQEQAPLSKPRLHIRPGQPWPVHHLAGQRPQLHKRHLERHKKK